MRRTLVFVVLGIVVVVGLLMETGNNRRPGVSDELDRQAIGEDSQPAAETDFDSVRLQMVRDQILARGVNNRQILDAMGSVPRHRFVLDGYVHYAYTDTPLPIGFGQTISQPYIVALMTELAAPAPTDRVLEVGTGSGYQAAVISTLVDHVFTIEIVPGLGLRAEQVLADLGYRNVTVRVGDGYAGWAEEGPFDIILVTAAPEEIPPALVEQLAVGGRMVVPVGPVYGNQDLLLLKKHADGTVTEDRIIPVRFVPMVHGE